MAQRAELAGPQRGEPVVPVPVALFDQLLTLAAKGLTTEARVNGITPRPGLGRLLSALETARRDAVAPAAEAAEPDPLSVAQAAVLLGISKRHALRRIAAGTLPARRVAGRWLVERAACPDRDVA